MCFSSCQVYDNISLLDDIHHIEMCLLDSTEAVHHCQCVGEVVYVNVLTLTTTCDSISRIVDYTGTLEAARCICAQSIPITVVHSSCTFINF